MSSTVGCEFSSYDSLKTFVRDLEEKHFIQLYKANSRTIEGSRKRGYQAYVKPELLYTELVYKCIHGGARRLSRSTGKRPGQSTFRQECPFFIRFKAKGDVLVAVDGNEEHNHPHDEATSSYLPRHRILDGYSKEFAKQMLHMGANKRALQVELQKKTNKKVTLRDLYNLSEKRKCNVDSLPTIYYTEETEATMEEIIESDSMGSNSGFNDSLETTMEEATGSDDIRSSNEFDDSLEAIIDYFETKEDCNVELIKSEENSLLGIFYQDREMKRVFGSYPEILYVDTIHEASDQLMPLYIFLSEDGNGESEIVGFYLVRSEQGLDIMEDKATMKQLAEVFKKHNPSWLEVHSIMTEKDFVGRDVFRAEFPNAKLLICLSHVLRTFRREITVLKMGIKPHEREKCLEIIKKIAYSDTENDYNSHLKELEEIKLTPVIEYYKNNWHSIRDEWIIQSNSLTLGHQTNNNLEKIYSKVVQVFKKNSKLTELFPSLDNLLLSLRTERDSRAAKIQLKVPIINYEISDAERKYMLFLTPYAYDIVAKKFRQKEKVELTRVDDLNFTAISPEGILSVTAEQCSCSFFKSIKLPCHHLLKVRELEEIDLYCEKLVSERWTKQYYVTSGRLLVDENFTSDSQYRIGSAEESTIKVFSQHEKIKLVQSRIQKLALLASEAPARLFSQRLEVLDSIIECWGKGCEVSVNPLNTMSDFGN